MADISGLAEQLRQLKASLTGVEGADQKLYQTVTNYAQKHGLSADVVAQVAREVAPNPGAWDANRVQTIMNQYDPRAKSYGLGPAFTTLQQGGTDASAAIARTQGQVGDAFNKGIQYLDPYMQQGGKANELQAALSGALGPEAQKIAFDSYSSSPGVQFAQKEAERALLRNASATGGLGGGNVLRDLTQLAAGTAMQDFGNQFSRLGEVANRGYGAATAGAGMRGQEASIQSGLGQFAANIPLQTSQSQANYQFQTGRDISTNVANTTSALATLLSQQGAGMADITGNQTNNIATLFQNASNGDSNAITQLQTILGNLSTGSASMVGGLPIIQGQPSNLLGQVGSVAGGIGGLASGLGYGQRPATQPVYDETPGSFGLDYNSTTGFWRAPSMVAP